MGVLLLVPLGDVLERRKLLPSVMSFTVLALIACAAAPSFNMLLMALGCLGLVTVSGQIILPLAGDMASNDMRGRIVGIVSSGITAGILFSRLISGLVANLWDWRGIFILAAALNLIMVAVVFYSVPKIPVRAKISYFKLLAGVFSSIRRYPAMRGIFFKQGMIFGIAFNLFWTAMTFLLSDEPFGFSTLQIGLVSLAGLTGAAAGSKLGTLQDRGQGYSGMAVFIAMSAVCMILAAFSGLSILALVLIAAIFSLAIQGVSVLSQAQLFELSNTERSRLNTAFVVSNFLFSAVGSGLASFLWSMGGWIYVAAGAALASFLALSVHLCSRFMEKTVIVSA